MNNYILVSIKNNNLQLQKTMHTTADNWENTKLLQQVSYK